LPEHVMNENISILKKSLFILIYSFSVITINFLRYRYISGGYINFVELNIYR